MDKGLYKITSEDGEIFQFKKQPVKLNFQDVVLVINSVLASLGYYELESLSIKDSSSGVITYISPKI